MREQISEIAKHLIRDDTIVDGRAKHLIGHEKPFGHRWSVRAGSNNFVPETVLTRRLELPSQQEPEGIRAMSIFKGLYLQEEWIVNSDFTEIFSDLTNVTFETYLQYGTVGIIKMVERPDQEEATSLRSGDLGRMMLVDELLFDQGIRTNNRQLMNIGDAELVLSNLATIRT